MRTPIFGDSDPKNYRLKFNILELVSTFKKSGYFIDLFWRFCSFINAAILLAESILLHILGTSFLHQTDDLQYNNTENNKNFNYRTNSAKVKNYFFLINWKKKNYFWPNFDPFCFSVFGAKDVFLKKFGSVTNNVFGLNS